MGLSGKAIFLSLASIILQFKSGNSQCFNKEAITIPKLGLSESQFWNAKAQDLEQCAKLCLRRKPCLSITYDTKTGMCELNAGTRTDTPTKTGASLLYSEVQWWPSSLDKNCHSRPCKDNEACISGFLANGSPDCSYSCITVSRDVCPLPPGGVSNGRTVGSVDVFTCGKGTIGGGNATCLDTLQWDKELVRNCTPIFNYSCSDDNSICSPINGTCSESGKCECGHYKKYNDTIKECVLDCGDPPVVNNAQVSGDMTTQTYQCDTDYFPTTGSEPTVNCTDSGWGPSGNFSCRTCGSPPNVAGATLSGAGKVRQYTCGTKMYPLPGKGNGTITCDADSTSWIPDHFACGGLRLNQSTDAHIVEGAISGYLEMFADGEWRALTADKWTWKATKVACRKLLGTDFGGTFHEKWFGIENPSHLPKMFEYKNITCTGEEEALERCTKQNLKKGDWKKDKAMALTCFGYDFTTSENVKFYDEDKKTLLTKISNSYGGVCESGWKDEGITVAIRSMNTSWTEQSKCDKHGKHGDSTFNGRIHTSNIECVGDEPHLFYCQNSGWGYADCEKKDLVTIEC